MAPSYLSSQYFHALLLGICVLVSTLSNIIERLQKLSTGSNVIKVNDCCGNKLCFYLVLQDIVCFTAWLLYKLDVLP